MIVSVDPGNCSGLAEWAVLTGRAVLGQCLLVPPEGIEAFEDWRGQVDLLVIERPILQRGDLQNLPRALKLAQDLAGVNEIAGRWIQALRPKALRQPTPHDWGGSVPKGIKNARTLEKLSEAELRRVPKGHLAHNGIDAIGIGLDELPRWGLR